jgi:hypothetical protein
MHDFLQIDCNIILQSMRKYLRVSLSSDFPVMKVMYASYPLITYAPHVQLIPQLLTYLL